MVAQMALQMRERCA